MAPVRDIKRALLGGCLTGLKGGVKEGKEENLQPLVYEMTAILVPQIVGQDNSPIINELQHSKAERGGVKRFISSKGDGIFDTPTSLKRAVAWCQRLDKQVSKGFSKDR